MRNCFLIVIIFFLLIQQNGHAEELVVDTLGEDIDVLNEDFAVKYVVIDTADRKRVDVKEVTTKAETGDRNAQRLLGILYYQGKGIKQSYNEAFKWFSKAAIQDDSFSQNALGVMYVKGQGFPQNYDEGIKWLRRSADNRFALGQLNFGIAYEFGLGIEPDETKARKLIESAADQMLGIAESYLAEHYVRGILVPKDYVKAYELSSLAYVHGFMEAMKLRDKLVRVLTKDELKAAQKRTSKLISDRGPNSIQIIGPNVK